MPVLNAPLNLADVVVLTKNQLLMSYRVALAAGKRGLRANAEWIRLNNCPVGYAAVPYPVGGDGDLYHINLEMNF